MQASLDINSKLVQTSVDVCYRWTKLSEFKAVCSSRAIQVCKSLHCTLHLESAPTEADTDTCSINIHRRNAAEMLC